MKVIYNSLIPFKGFKAINLFGVVFARKKFKGQIELGYTLEHEAIHTAQMREMLYIGFYLWYFFEWLIKLFIYGSGAYYQIGFEQEAFCNQANPTYLQYRKPFAWLRYFKR